MNPNELTHKKYIGDGVYVGFDSHNRLWTYTSNGLEVTNAICFEPEVFETLLIWLNSIKNMGRENIIG